MLVVRGARYPLLVVYAHKIGGAAENGNLSQRETTVISFTRDDRPQIFDGLPLIGIPGLGFLPVIEKIGQPKAG
jgi:hypothetical protein